MKNFLYTLAILASTSFISNAQSGLFIDTSYTAEQMIMDFFDNSCVTPSNITFNGSPVMMGYFEGANTDLGVNAGIVISTGDVTQLSQAAGVFATTANNADGDPDLGSLVFLPTYDAAVLEFDITVADTGDLEFQYVFGSEEYPEYVGSGFNDIFAFFVDDQSGSGMQNIAMIPGTTTPVAINNVNAGQNSGYFVDYEAIIGQHVAFDGLTTVLPATYASGNGATYHVKIGVTDVSDGIFDSGVFISTLSLCGPGLVNPPAQFSAQLIDNKITLSNQSRYATSWHWDFGDGTTSEERYPAAHEYTNPGTYVVTLTTHNYCCSDTYSLTMVVGPLATDELAENGFEVFPNPVRDELNIQVEKGMAFEYQICDISGRMVAKGEQQGALTLQTGAWERGLYLLTVRTHSGVFTKKLSLL